MPTRLVWAVAIASPFVTHWALATGRHWLLAASFAVVQVGVIVGMAFRQARLRWWTIPLIALSAGLLLTRIAELAWAGRTGSAEAGLVIDSALSHAAIYLSLLTVFGSSLRTGSTPLVTALAQRLRGPLSEAVIGYTRRVTWLWCGYFLGQLIMSAALLLWASITIWSLFVNVMDAPLLLTVFLGEFAFRLWRLPMERHVSPVAIMLTFNCLDAPADAG